MNALPGAVEFIAATGGAQLGWAALTVLGDIAMGVGALIMLGLACWLIFYALAWWHDRRHPFDVITTDDDELGEDVNLWWGRGIPDDVRQAIADRETYNLRPAETGGPPDA